MFEILIPFGIGAVNGLAIACFWYSWKIETLANHGDECGKIILKQKARIYDLEGKIELLEAKLDVLASKF